MTITVLIVDDHAVVRDGLRAILESESDIEVIGSVIDGREAVQETTRLKPDVVLMDIAMPELNGIEAAAQIRDACEATSVIILSMYATSEHVFRAMQAGVQGYLVKESAGAEVVNAVRRVHDGERYLSRKISDAVIETYVKQHQAKSPLESLSPREREILQLVVEGLSSNSIALRLGLSPKTVETYRGRLMQKLDVDNLPALVRFALQHGLTPGG
ncbi:MAG: DNA-binding response regulator [Betaproteobacteria bacterium RIFCSPLOWO2_02_FULL_63_19]|nr:MAG: DNA-binding response regulator [Betaproteobacteria bacterium RIFCSPLOWO2_02_FULL_63_19]